MLVLNPTTNKFETVELTGPVTNTINKAFARYSNEQTVPLDSQKSITEIKQALAKLGSPAVFVDRVDNGGFGGEGGKVFVKFTVGSIPRYESIPLSEFTESGIKSLPAIRSIASSSLNAAPVPEAAEQNKENSQPATPRYANSQPTNDLGERLALSPSPSPVSVMKTWTPSLELSNPMSSLPTAAAPLPRNGASPVGFASVSPTAAKNETQQTKPNENPPPISIAETILEPNASVDGQSESNVVAGGNVSELPAAQVPLDSLTSVSVAILSGITGGVSPVLPLLSKAFTSLSNADARQLVVSQPAAAKLLGLLMIASLPATTVTLGVGAAGEKTSAESATAVGQTSTETSGALTSGINGLSVHSSLDEFGTLIVQLFTPILKNLILAGFKNDAVAQVGSTIVTPSNTKIQPTLIGFFIPHI